MSYHDYHADQMCAKVDTSGYERIGMNQFRTWLSNGELLRSSSCEPSTGRRHYNENVSSQYGHYTYNDATTITRSTDDSLIHTYSEEETRQRLAELVGHVLRLKPRIVTESGSHIPITYQQRIIIQHLQPPALPPPGPILIEEVRPRQPPPLPPLVIRQHRSRVRTPPPVILRERPPKPPVHGCSEKFIRELSPLPVPQRSVRVEIMPQPPEKPRDIRIERWLPYGPQPEREIFIKRAPAIAYSEPAYTEVRYQDVDKRIERKVENLGVIQENPYEYKARYGTSLLDSALITQEVRNAGVTEDISSSTVTPLINTNTYGNADHVHASYESINQGCSSSIGTNYKGTHVVSVTKTPNLGETSCSSSTVKHIGYSSSVDDGCGAQSEVHVRHASASISNTKCDETLNQREPQAYI